MTHIHIKNYEHINRAFKNWNTPYGRYIKSKSDYEKAMHQENMVPIEKLKSEPTRKQYKVSKDTIALVNQLKTTTDKKGYIHPEGRALEELIKRKQKLSSKQPKSATHDKGGFSNES